MPRERHELALFCRELALQGSQLESLRTEVGLGSLRLGLEVLDVLDCDDLAHSRGVRGHDDY